MSAVPQHISFNGTTPSVDPAAWIAPTATLIGAVTIGPRVGVYYGAVVRGDSSTIVIGAGSNLQDNVVVHADPGFPATVGAGVSVGHAAVLHGCTVEDDCLIGMGAVVLNGAVIGRGSMIAAGSRGAGGCRHSGRVAGGRRAGQGPPRTDHRRAGRHRAECVRLRRPVGCAPRGAGAVVAAPLTARRSLHRAPRRRPTSRPAVVPGRCRAGRAPPRPGRTRGGRPECSGPSPAPDQEPLHP